MSILQEVLLKPENQNHIRSLQIHSVDLWPHSYKVAAMMEQMYPYMLSDELPVEDAVTGALFHDIGKIFVPEEILDKKGKLTQEEMQEIKKHPRNGAMLLADRSLEIRNMALLHHEKADGSGYPYGYPEEFLPLYCRVLTMLDVYDAIATKRVYKDPCHDIEEAISMLQDIPIVTKKGSMDKALDLIRSGKVFIPEYLSLS